ncbi:hypothetical protein SARC_06069 [Sphaeroforma arctica JP610]|uniref:CWH43-like N-terminal domain-containing protein n=1 Tax=Sphaeroforma arctica JP610 TaxID=667725 RepID=A0A0L0G094_9EUKA|nr:hypothetical protein SARC_06069 [Sphaeroforma arctica JP610]KNC81613.1 hypothetical protein SARC_06069 [Sphaeroforma arctica JP610]|eukprot:XP_014155515.1 hypothetical protein SARC_06069 [Sphaeroforma arctica JP610]
MNESATANMDVDMDIDLNVSPTQLLSISHTTLSIVTGYIIPVIGLLSCLIYVSVYEFEDVNDTHCKVANVLPSLSSVIGNYPTVRYIWTFCLLIGMPTRVIDSVAYYNYFRECIGETHMLACLATLVLLTVENFGLSVLTVIPSGENHTLHAYGFGMFLCGGVLAMATVAYLFSALQDSTNANMSPRPISLKWKRICLTLNLCAIATSMYFYWRHNKYCEPYVFSLFALCEYIVVLTNMASHASAMWDFKGMWLTFGSSSAQYGKLV